MPDGCTLAVLMGYSTGLAVSNPGSGVQLNPATVEVAIGTPTPPLMMSSSEPKVTSAGSADQVALPSLIGAMSSLMWNVTMAPSSPGLTKPPACHSTSFSVDVHGLGEHARDAEGRCEQPHYDCHGQDSKCALHYAYPLVDSVMVDRTFSTHNKTLPGPPGLGEHPRFLFWIIMICTPRLYLCQGSLTDFCRGKP